MKSMINYLLEVSSLPTPLAGISFSICLFRFKKVLRHGLQLVPLSVDRVLAEMEVEPTPIDTKGFQKLVQVV